MKVEIILMVASIGLGDAYGVEGAIADDLSRRRGHRDCERDVFPSISANVLLSSRAVTPARGRWGWRSKI